MKEDPVNAQRPTFWLTYISEQTEIAPNEITAIAPEILDRPRLSGNVRMLLAATDAYHDAHPHERVVYLAAVTRWLFLKYVTWRGLDVDFSAALIDLDRYSPALLIEASEIAVAVVANAALHHTILVVGELVPIPEDVDEDVRTAILEALERDWPDYITGVLERHAARC